MRIVFQGTIFILFTTTLPLQIAVTLTVWMTSGSPVIFCQKRIGKNGKPFTMYKFRTMQNGAEDKKKLYVSGNESDGPTFKIWNDPRFTPIGKFLSHTGLDELPQLWNVLKGEMALIGPRPLPVSEAKKLKSWMREREKVLPGIISPAILAGDYHKDFTKWMKVDVAYARSKSASGDVKLLFRSVAFLFRLFIREIFGVRA